MLAYLDLDKRIGRTMRALHTVSRSDHKRKQRFALGALLAVFLSAFLTNPGMAHANLLRSDPADGSILVMPPSMIQLWFDELVSGQFSSAQLFDADSQPIEVTVLGTDPADPTHLLISIPELSPGVYSVLWKILSETDGHYSQGLLVFGVGEQADLGSASPAPAEDPKPPIAEALLRWLNLLMITGLIGSIAMVQLVIPLAIDSEMGSTTGALVFQKARIRMLRLASLFAWGGVLTGFGLLFWQAQTLRSSLTEASSVFSMAWQALTTTRWGGVWSARQLAFLSLGIVVWIILKQNRNAGGIHASSRNTLGQTSSTNPVFWHIANVLCIGLIMVQAFSSHAAGLMTQTTLAIVSDMLHLLGASLWVGGLLSLAVGILPLLRAHQGEIGVLVRAGWRPFSIVAALSVGLLVATGLYNSGRQVASLDALFTTLYGQVLMGKFILLFGVGFFGLMNSALLHPWLIAPLAKRFGRSAGWTPLPIQRLPLLILMEVSLGLIVLLATGLLTASAAPRDAPFTVAAEDQPASLSQTVGDVVMTLSVKPNRPGNNVFTVFAASTRRPATAEIARVMLRFHYLDQAIGRETAVLEEIEPGRFLLGGNYLSLAGNWQIDVIVRRLGMEDSVAQFNWSVVPPGVTRPVLVSKAPLEDYLTLAAASMLLMIPVVAFGLGRLRKRRFAPQTITADLPKNEQLEMLVADNENLVPEHPYRL